MELGNYIKHLRLEKGLSQKQLAEKAKVSQSSINYWEKGERRPKIEQFQKIAYALEISPCDLLNEDYKEKKDAFTKKLLDIYHENESDEIAAKEVDRNFNGNFINELTDIQMLKGDAISESYKWACREIENSLLMMSMDGHKEAVKRIKELESLEQYHKKNNFLD